QSQVRRAGPRRGRRQGTGQAGGVPRAARDAHHPAGRPVIRTYEEAVAYLDRHIGRGMHPGLTRINELLAMMGDPQDAYPIIHVAGTNGKTSVARMTTMLLVAHGL